MKFYDFIDSNKDKNITFYFDMDGVLAEYDIYNFDYNTIRPLTSIIEVVKNLIDSNYEVKILSICKNNNNYRPSYALNYKTPIEYKTQLGFK